MSNVLTAVQERLFASARKTPQELTGFLGACTRDFDHKGVEKGGTVKVPTIPKFTVGSVPSPAMAFTIGTDRTPSTIDFTLNQTAEVSWNLTGEEERQLVLGGTVNDILEQTMAQAWRAHRNQIETYLAQTAAKNASRAYGTAGTTPFASDLTAASNIKKILDDNGAPADRSIILGTTAGVNLRNLSNLFKVNEAGSADLLRVGVLGDLFGMAVRESAAPAVITKGTGSGYLVNMAGNLAIGDTSITVDTGTGTILAGDVITLAGDTNKYVVKTTLASNVVVIQEPGLKAAHLDNDAITVGGNYTNNIALCRAALAAVVRPILQPQASNIEQMVLTDPATGFSALLIRTVGDQVASWYLRSVYDAFSPNPYGMAILLG